MGVDFSLAFSALQAVLLVLYAIFVRYEDEDELIVEQNTAKYFFYQNVHVMIFLGFGFLMTFLRKHGFTAVGHSLVVAVVSVEVWILVGGFFKQAFDPNTDGHYERLKVGVAELIGGDFAAAAVLITFGALIGKVTLPQMVLITVVEVVCYSLNANVYTQVLKAVDVGGSVVIHTFGAYFGLACATVLNRNPAAKEQDGKNNASVYISDIFSLVGTIFLWMYWPSFNAALSPTDSTQQNRILVNTLFALMGSVVATFVLSRKLHVGRFNMVEVQNATLAGGVAVGCASNMRLYPAGAMGVGTVAGVVSTLGYRYLLDLVKEKWGVDDTCGVNNLHGMPGIVGGIVGVIAVASGAATGPFTNRSGSSRTEGTQAGFQVAGLMMTLVFALISGTVTGAIARKLKILEHFYHDQSEYELEEDIELDDEEEVVHPALAAFTAPSPPRHKPASGVYETETAKFRNAMSGEFGSRGNYGSAVRSGRYRAPGAAPLLPNTALNADDPGVDLAATRAP